MTLVHSIILIISFVTVIIIIKSFPFDATLHTTSSDLKKKKKGNKDNDLSFEVTLRMEDKHVKIIVFRNSWVIVKTSFPWQHSFRLRGNLLNYRE